MLNFFLRPFFALGLSLLLSALVSAGVVYVLACLWTLLLRAWRWLLFIGMTLLFTGVMFAWIMEEDVLLDHAIDVTLGGARGFVAQVATWPTRLCLYNPGIPRRLCALLPQSAGVDKEGKDHCDTV